MRNIKYIMLFISTQQQPPPALAPAATVDTKESSPSCFTFSPPFFLCKYSLFTHSITVWRRHTPFDSQMGSRRQTVRLVIESRPIRNHYLGHVTGYQPIRDQYFLFDRFLLEFYCRVLMGSQFPLLGCHSVRVSPYRSRTLGPGHCTIWVHVLVNSVLIGSKP
eukprot:sb/3472715/